MSTRVTTKRLARQITQSISIPTVGIGASKACDGQILVLEDMLGMSDRVPKFVRRFADIGSDIRTAIAAYSDAVKRGTFPAHDHLYGAVTQDGATNWFPTMNPEIRIDHFRNLHVSHKIIFITTCCIRICLSKWRLAQAE